VTRVRGDLPADLERIVTRCLEKNPRERAQSALDVNNELRRLRKTLERGAPESPTSTAPEKVASIAVLPFVNRSASADDEYFSDGLADELINVLAKIRGLRVVARTSSFQFKGTKDDIATIGQRLNVATVLEGSVRKAGNRIRVAVQLVQVSDSSHLWSETYDRTLEDIFAVQDDIAQSVVRELRTTLLGEAPDSDASGQARAEVAQAAMGRGSDPEAHRLYLLGRHFLDRGSREDVTTGIAYLKQALEIDPAFALGWAELSRAFAREAGAGWVPPSEAYARAREAVQRALSLKPDLGEAHAGLARIRLYQDWDWRDVEASARRALELAPGSAPVLRVAAVVAEVLGHADECVALNRRALELDPLNAAAWNNIALPLIETGRLAEAEQAYRRSLELGPRRDGPHASLAYLLLAQGRLEEALVMALQEPEEAMRLQALSIVHHRRGEAKESDEALRELSANHAENFAFQVAEAHAARGEADAAFDWLERAYQERDAGLSFLRISSHLPALHGDPRWRPFLKKMGFEV
jgi:TolB-like protein/tetratricopeptide (TPR) repeat protein